MTSCGVDLNNYLTLFLAEFNVLREEVTTYRIQEEAARMKHIFDKKQGVNCDKLLNGAGDTAPVIQHICEPSEILRVLQGFLRRIPSPLDNTLFETDKILRKSGRRKNSECYLFQGTNLDSNGGQRALP